MIKKIIFIWQKNRIIAEGKVKFGNNLFEKFENNNILVDKFGLYEIKKIIFEIVKRDNFQKEILCGFGPSLFTFIYLKFIQLISHFNGRITIIALLPSNSHISLILGRLLFNEKLVILSQSDYMERMYEYYGYKSHLLPLYGSNLGHKIKNIYENYVYDILHVGHLKFGRGISSIIELKRRIPALKILIISSPLTNRDKDLRKQLFDLNIDVIDYYVSNIQDYYNKSKIYLFPTKLKNNAIQIPLSIIEALSCGMIVVTYNYGGIKLIGNNESLLFYSEISQLEKVIINLKAKNYDRRSNWILNRQKFSWENANKKVLNYLES